MKEPAADLATLVLAVLIAALVRVDSALALALSYAGAWLVVNVVRILGWPRTPVSVDRRVLAASVVVLLLVPLRDLSSRVSAWSEHEALASPLEHVADRLALEADPSIAPGLVSADRPQTYFLRASGSHVRVRLGEGIEWIEAEGLGHGVFRLTYDPRIQGVIAARLHETTASIEVDGDVSFRTLLAVTPMAHPRWVRLSPDRTRACVVSEETDELVMIAIGREPAQTETLDGPTDCQIADDGSALVTHRFASDVLLIDAVGARTAIDAGGPGAVSVTLLGERICVVREAAFSEVRCVGLPPLAIEGTPLFVRDVDGEALLIATRSPAALLRIEVHDGALAIVASRRLASPAVHLATDRGGRVWAALTDFDDAGHVGLGNHFIQDRVARFDGNTLALAEDRLTTWRTERQDHAGDVDRGASPMGLSSTERGTLWVAFAGTDEIEEIGRATPRVIDTARFGVSAPFSAAELSNGSIVVTSPSSGLVAILHQDGELERAVVLAPDDHELLTSDPSALQLRFGERAFYESTRSGVSCQSCHLHGATDGAAHNIGGRLAAPTLDVRGLLGTSPYLRDGSYPRLRDLHEVADAEYRGYREPAGDRGATTEAWMRALPLPPTFAPRDPALEREGLDVFFRAGCPDCHAPPAFTSLALHSVEAVFPDALGEARLLDVPSLRALSVSAPYLYDGRAPTLRALLTEQNTSDRHGHTRALEAHALEALIAFLESL